MCAFVSLCVYRRIVFVLVSSPSRRGIPLFLHHEYLPGGGFMKFKCCRESSAGDLFLILTPFCLSWSQVPASVSSGKGCEGRKGKRDTTECNGLRDGGLNNVCFYTLQWEWTEGFCFLKPVASWKSCLGPATEKLDWRAVQTGPSSFSLLLFSQNII